MGKTLQVACRDFRYTVLTKAFIFGVLALPLLMAVVIGVSVLIMKDHEEPPLVGTVTVITDSSALAASITDRFTALSETTSTEHLKEALTSATETMGTSNPFAADMAAMEALSAVGRGEIHITVQQLPADVDIDAIKEEVLAGQHLVVAVMPTGLLTATDGEYVDKYTLLINASLDADHVDLIERELGRGIVRQRVTQAGLSYDDARALMQTPKPETSAVREGGETTNESEGFRQLKQMIPMAFMMLIWIATFSTGQQLLQSTIEEKSSKVMEVLLSAVSPMQLITGKILGQCAAGLIIVVIYGGLVIGGIVALASMHFLPPILLLWLLLYFFMAFFMVAAIMAAVGSAVSDMREASNLMGPVMLLLMFPLMLWLPISNAPNGMVATIFSFVPPATPFVMILRVCADEVVPLWQILLSLVWGGACTVGMMWMSARIFRIGILMQGKPPSPLQLLKWMRYR
jgi:ABC-2 type transport system permease protein